MTDLQAAVVNDDALDDELQEHLPVGRRSLIQPGPNPLAERRQVRHDCLGLGALFAQAALLLDLKVEGFALIGQLPAPLLQFLQTDHLQLVSVEQTPVRTRQPIQACPQLPLGVRTTRRSLTSLPGELLELGEQPVGIAEQADDMVPDRLLQIVGLDLRPRTRRGSGGRHAVLAGAPVIPELTPIRRLSGDPVHGQAALPAGQQTAQQIIMLPVVPE